jgi:MFS family permease
MLQGLALGGEYGGAATYVAEHAPIGKRGFHTSWIQSTATLGLLLSLLVVLGCRYFTGDQFEVWGWRIPFLFSIILLGISTWIRLSLHESPAFVKMKEEGKLCKSPIRDSFGKWENLKVVLIALFSINAGQAVTFYAAQFYVLFFLTQFLKMDPAVANGLLIVSVTIGAPFFIFFGWLSDKVGRKPVLMLGLLLATALYFPIFKTLAHYANPAIDQASRQAPGANHRAGGSGHLHLPVRPGGQGEIRQPLRQGQDLPGQAGPAVPERSGPGRQRRAGERR